MSFLGFFRRRPPVADAGALADFIDQHSAFLVQKGLYEYSRARAGHYAKVLFGEPEFQEAIERSRWQAFPLGLAMVGELVEGVLRPHGSGGEHGHLEAICELVLSVFDRYPVPAALGATAWSQAHAELARRLQLVGMHAPKRAMDIPEPFVDSYFALMPIHERLREADYPVMRNYLRVTMCNIHDELSKRLDAAAVIGALRAGAGAVPPREA